MEQDNVPFALKICALCVLFSLAISHSLLILSRLTSTNDSQPLHQPRSSVSVVTRFSRRLFSLGFLFGCFQSKRKLPDFIADRAPLDISTQVSRKGMASQIERVRRRGDPDLARREAQIGRLIELNLQLTASLQATEDEDERLWNEDGEEGDSSDDSSDHISRYSNQTDDGHSDHEDLIQRTCVACMDTMSERDTHRCPCGHYWCQTCTVDRFEMAAGSSRLFPAQCCGLPILPDYHALIARETWGRYFGKRNEIETPDPTFCFRRDCSKFVPMHQIDEGRQARCVCGQITCAVCKAEWHFGECAVDPVREQVLRLASEERWQICFHCKAIVDRRDGCNELGMYNMTTILGVVLEARTNHQPTGCPCGHTFCYACGLQWKTCSCPQFGGAEPSTPPQARPEPRISVFTVWELWPLTPSEPSGGDSGTQPLVTFRGSAYLGSSETDEADDMAMYVEPGELPGHSSPATSGCDVHSWRRIGGGRTCQSCNTLMPNFLFQCRGCRHTSC